MSITTDPYVLVQKARDLGCDFAPGATFEEEQRQATAFLNRLEDTQDERAAAVVTRELVNWVPSQDRATWTHPDAPKYSIVCVGRVEEGPLRGLAKWRGIYDPQEDRSNTAFIGNEPTLSLDVAFLMVEDHRWLAGTLKVESTYRIMAAGLPGAEDVELGTVTATGRQEAEQAALGQDIATRDIGFYAEEVGE